MRIHCLGHLPLPLDPLLGRNCSALLFSDFVEYIRDNNKKNIAFLLVWDKDSSIERFPALLACTCVLQPTLVPFYQTSSLLPTPLPVVVSASLRLLYLLLYSEHINCIHVLGFLPFPYSSHARYPLSVWPMSNNTTAFVLGLKSTYEGEHVSFTLLSLANFT
jgi:hypothetical protein